MRNKIMYTALAGMIIFSMSGCKEAKKDTYEAVDTLAYDVDCIEVEIIPNPNDYFKDSNITFEQSENNYIFSIDKPEVRDYEKYLESCKNRGFADITGKTNYGNNPVKTFYGCDEDNEYYLNLIEDFVTGEMTIVCNVK